MSAPDSIEARLVRVFNLKHSKALLRHFSASIEAFQTSHWELCIVKGGKFIEAVLKAMSLQAGIALLPARQFNVGRVVTSLRQLGAGTINDTIRITIPRACEFVYDIASNRGARHDPDEVDPNEMDATIMVATESWILAELLRYSQRGAIDQAVIRELIDGLIQRRFPPVEEVDGRVYFHIRGLSGRDVALLALWRNHPKRMSRDELIEVIGRHGNSSGNANVSLNRISRVVDIDSAGKYRLLQPGLDEAERIMKNHG